MNNTPLLIEPGTRYFLHNTLKQCHSYKEKYKNTVFNICAAIVFISTVIIILWWRYKGRLTKDDISLKNKQKKEYILSKLQYLAAIRKENNQKNNMITDLPTFDTQPELMNLRRI